MEFKIKIYPCLKVSQDKSVVDVAKLMASKKERRVFVVGKDDKLLGILTTTDLVSKVVAKKKLTLKVKDVMTKKVSAIDLDDPVDNALAIMNQHETFVCPVVEKGKFKGVISYHDILAYITNSLNKEE